MFYDNLRAVCAEKGTTVTTVLKELHMSTGSTGKWKEGSIPKIDTVMQLAEHLDVSLDYLVYGRKLYTEVSGLDPGLRSSRTFRTINRKCVKTFSVLIWLFRKSTQIVKGDNIITIFYMAKKSLP